MGHSPEPWELGYYGTVRDASGRVILASPEDASDDNLRRLVACVNACAGIPTEDLESRKVVPLNFSVLSPVFGKPPESPHSPDSSLDA